MSMGGPSGPRQPSTGRPTTSRHESNSYGFGTNFRNDDQNNFGGNSINASSTAAQRAVKARELAAAKRRERQMGSGVVSNETNMGGDQGGFGGNASQRFQPLAPSMSNYPSHHPSAPSRLTAPGGFSRLKPPNGPRPTSRVGGGVLNIATGVRANPLFSGGGATGNNPAPPMSNYPHHSNAPYSTGNSDSGYGYSEHPPSPKVSGGGFMGSQPTLQHESSEKVIPFDDGIETLELGSPGSPKARGNPYGGNPYGNPNDVDSRNPHYDDKRSEHLQNASLVGDDRALKKTSRLTPAQVGTTDRKVFLSQPAPRNGDPVQCHIVRRKGKGGVMGFGAKRYPEYFLYLDGPGASAGQPTDAAVFLLSARKRKKSTSSNYVISLDEDDLDRQSDSFFGKLRSNFMGTEFTIFDKGAKPGAVEIDNSTDGGGGQFSSHNTVVPGMLPPRTELGAVCYEYNVLGTKGPRVMSGAIPKVDPNSGRRAIFRPTDSNGTNGILEALKKKPTPDTEDLIVLRNKQPRWNEQMQAYCLNFNGRVTLASVKNFQLADNEDPDESTILQFGKVGKDMFTVDYFYPMSAIQAFAICLSSFDNKLACE